MTIFRQIQGHRGVNSFTLTAELSLQTSPDSECFSEESRATSRARSTNSETRNSARPCPRTTSGSGATMSVHCGGTEQMALSSTHSKSRLPAGLERSPTQTSCRPPNGWKGCVMRTSLTEAEGRSAFEGELQAIGARQVSLAAGAGRLRTSEHGAIVHAAGRDRLARAGSQFYAGSCLLIDKTS